MSGGPFDKRMRMRLRNASKGNAEDQCDLTLLAELVGVRREVSETLRSGDALRVSLVASGDIRSGVCQNTQGLIVGALAAIQGLTDLLECLEKGVVYTGRVVDADATRCVVVISRADQ